VDLKLFLLTFIPLFVAIDSKGLVPLYLGLTESIDKDKKSRLVFNAAITAFVICVAFRFIGKEQFGFIGITVNDFRIAGGIVLLSVTHKNTP